MAQRPAFGTILPTLVLPKKLAGDLSDLLDLCLETPGLEGMNRSELVRQLIAIAIPIARRDLRERALQEDDGAMFGRSRYASRGRPRTTTKKKVAKRR